MLSEERLIELFAAIRKLRVLVIGDAALDRYIHGETFRLSRDGPIPVIETMREELMLGGAANTAANCASLGAAVKLIGVFDMRAGAQLKRLLSCAGVEVVPLLCSDLTVETQRVLCRKTHVCRVDFVRQTPLSLSHHDILRFAEGHMRDANAVIVSDYDKGVVTGGLMTGLSKRCQANNQFLAYDPKTALRETELDVSLLQTNRDGAVLLADLYWSERTTYPLDTICERIHERHKVRLLSVTLGRFGSAYCSPDEKPSLIAIPDREPVSNCGAGDTMIAATTLAMCAGATRVEAVEFGNLAASFVCTKFGTVSANARDLIEHARSASAPLSVQSG
jgi:rfaE bifunctional protein kinase chain/domain